MKTWLFDLGNGGYYFTTAQDVESARGKFERSVGGLGADITSKVSNIQPREVTPDQIQQYFGGDSESTISGSTSKSKTTV